MLNSNKIILAVAASLLIQANAHAEEHHEGRKGHPQEHTEAWHGDIHHFHERDIEIWRGGRWVHGWHQGHGGWWWLAGGVWYSYLTPIYPYPDPYQPPIVVAPQAPVEVAPPNPPSQPSTQAAQFWYYCTNPAGYYPYVSQCASGWQKVPASPPPQ
jgi:hypothetical protein